MNWRRGFFRIWMCASVFYVLVASIGLFEDIKNQALLQRLKTISSPDCDKPGAKYISEPLDKELDGYVVNKSPEFLECLKQEDKKSKTENSTKLMELLALIFLPPIAILAGVFIIIGLTKWIGKGFKNDRTI